MSFRLRAAHAGVILHQLHQLVRANNRMRAAQQPLGGTLRARHRVDSALRAAMGGLERDGREGPLQMLSPRLHSMLGHQIDLVQEEHQALASLDNLLLQGFRTARRRVPRVENLHDDIGGSEYLMQFLVEAPPSILRLTARVCETSKIVVDLIADVLLKLITTPSGLCLQGFDALRHRMRRTASDRWLHVIVGHRDVPCRCVGIAAAGAQSQVPHLFAQALLEEGTSVLREADFLLGVPRRLNSLATVL
mmetsp:Transcript_34956/g.96648  ORF Transcript_34956/g.96648 Transcript_34956/m.96648 type:complete len:249 (+) Transcript_34956:775-1521(+)